MYIHTHMHSIYTNIRHQHIMNIVNQPQELSLKITEQKNKPVTGAFLYIFYNTIILYVHVTLHIN